MKLSILIPSIESRSHVLSKMLENILLPQFINTDDGIWYENENAKGCDLKIYSSSYVQVIVATDNKSITTGAKRNLLLDWAIGEYCVFVDDDDEPYSYYVEQILKAIEGNPDCVAYNGIITVNGINSMEWRLSKDYPNITIQENGKSIYLRTTNHISAVKRELAIKAGFPDISNGEDAEYSRRLNPYLKTEAKINLPMYHYKCISKKEY